MKYLFILVLCLLYSLSGFAKPASEDEKLVVYNYKQWLYSPYYSKNNLHINDPEVEAIFDNVITVAHKTLQIPQLLIIKSPNKPSSVEGLTVHALIDNYIITTDRFIQKVRDIAGNDIELFQTFMAFIFGHELAHFSNQDYIKWYEFEHNKKLSSAVKIQKRQNIEIEADRLGFFYAAFAGYPIGKLTGKDNSHAVLAMLMERLKLENIVQKYSSESSKYPTTDERIGEIKRIWKNLALKYPFYEYGVRFAAFGRCDDAMLFFRQFGQLYSGKEVHNNMGSCFLQLTKKSMREAAYLYWLPNILDGDVDSLITMGDSSSSLTSLRSARLDRVIQGNLKAAAHHFEQAIEASPYYFASYINLGITYLYLGKPNRARVYLLEGLDLYTDTLQQTKRNLLKPPKAIEAYLKMLLYLSRYEYEMVNSNPWRSVVNDLIVLLNEYDEPLPEVIFNIARLLDIHSRTGEAQQYWKQLTKDSIRRQLPKPMLETVCNKQQGMDNLDCINTTLHNTAQKQWQYPFTLTNFSLYDQEPYEEIEKNWLELLEADTIEGMQISLYQEAATKNWELLAVDSYVAPTLFVNKQPNETVENLNQYCAHQPYKKTLAQNEVYLCADWAAKVVDGKVTEVWKQIK